MVHRPAFGDKKGFKDKLENYEGVRFRIEFFQFGFLNKNKYIIELYHKNHNKTVPLYISTSDKNIRRIWEYYARQLKLPALIMTDEGMAVRKVEDLDKSLRELAAQGLVENHYNSRAPLPPSLALVRKRDKTVIKTRKIIWDAYNIIAWVAIFLFGGILLAASLSDEFGTETGRNPFVLAAYIIGILGILASVWVFSRKNNELVKDDIESIDVAFTPATERYFVAISSDNKTMVFGKKLPIEDLRWVRQFLINDVVSK